MPRHGNAMKPTASDFFRKDPAASETIDEYLDQGLSVDNIYATMSKQVCQTVSETISGPKMIENQKFHKKASEETRDTAEKRSEAESLILSLKSVSGLKRVVHTTHERTRCPKAESNGM